MSEARTTDIHRGSAGQGYDYIVCGAGSAGSIIARRLAEANNSVLLLEAGQDNLRKDWRVQTPLAIGSLFQSDRDYNFKTTAQAELKDQELYYPRGKSVGGSSAINAMLYTRGHPSDFDEWAAHGCDGWSSSDVEEYFGRVERNQSKTHGPGSSGMLPISCRSPPTQAGKALQQAATAAGYSDNGNMLYQRAGYVGSYFLTVDRGKRQTSWQMYMEPILKKRSASRKVIVRTQAKVTNLIVNTADDGSKHVTGVQYKTYANDKSSDSYHFATARKEVILCLGAIGSPQVLMLSGIGPRTELESVGVSPVHELNGVGKNLQDHPCAPVAYKMDKKATLADGTSLPQVLSYKLFNRSKLSCGPGNLGCAMQTESADNDRPSVQLMFGEVVFLDHGRQCASEPGFSIMPVLLRPQSRGSVTLASSNPGDPPRINPNFFAEQKDFDNMVQGVKAARNIASKQSINQHTKGEIDLGYNKDDNDELQEYIRTMTQTTYHPVSTCAMGPSTSEDAVVDERVRVYGVHGLRVADASIMPTIPSGNTNAPTLMIAEKAADMILSDNN